MLEWGDDHGKDGVSAGKVGWGQVLECFEYHTSGSGYL